MAIILVVVGGAAIQDRTFKVNPDEQAIVLQFGEVKRLVYPGVHRKIPLIQDVYYCNMEVQRLELTTVEAQTSDLTRIGTDASVSYAIADCVRFLHSVRSPANLGIHLSRTLNATLRETLSRYSSPDLSGKRNEIVTDVTAQMNAVASATGVMLTDSNLSFSKQ